MGDKLRVVVVEDHDLFRGGLVDLLERRGVDVVGEARLGAEGVRLAQELSPDVVLMDLIMPGMSGIEATQRLASAAPLVRVVVLTVMADEDHLADALLAGACGYMLKDAPIDRIIEAIRAAANGESAISPRVAVHLVRRMREPARVEPQHAVVELTRRESEVLELLARGMDNPDIAMTLHLSQHTIKNHVSSILVKLQVKNRVQAAVRAVRRGMI